MKMKYPMVMIWLGRRSRTRFFLCIVLMVFHIHLLVFFVIYVDALCMFVVNALHLVRCVLIVKNLINLEPDLTSCEDLSTRIELKSQILHVNISY